MNATEMARVHAACFSGAPRAWSSEEFREILDGEMAHCNVIFHEAGFLVLRIIADEAEILTLAVDPARRREGIGRDLVRKAITQVRELGGTSLLLEVAEDNAAAFALYLGLGFEEIGVRRDYYRAQGGQKISANMMRCKVRPD